MSKNKLPATYSLKKVLEQEEQYGLENISTYEGFQEKAMRVKKEIREFLLNEKKAGRKVLGYGAAAKGNTLLNFAGIDSTLLEAIADKAKSKQGKYMPGSGIRIICPEELDQMSYDCLLVLPWNLLEEVSLLYKTKCLVTAIPELRIHDNGK